MRSTRCSHSSPTASRPRRSYAAPQLGPLSSARSAEGEARLADGLPGAVEHPDDIDVAHITGVSAPPPPPAAHPHGSKRAHIGATDRLEPVPAVRDPVVDGR